MKIYYEDENVKIGILLKDQDDKLLANANVILRTTAFGFITIKNFQIWKSSQFNSRIEENINIVPTNTFRYGKTYPLVFLENEVNWYELEALIYKAFVQAKEEFVVKNIDYDQVERGIEKQRKNKPLK